MATGLNHRLFSKTQAENPDSVDIAKATGKSESVNRRAYMNHGTVDHRCCCVINTTPDYLANPISRWVR